MFRQWLTLVIIVLVYIPVAIDATVLHVAAPTLSMTLGASGNELLWIIDIYSLVMAGMVLPMGALGDRIGFKRLLLLGGGLFGLASLAAAFAHSASWLIATRAVLAIGAAMIVPATLAGIRATFSEQRHRNMALGVWAAVGSGGDTFDELNWIGLRFPPRSNGEAHRQRDHQRQNDAGGRALLLELFGRRVAQ